VAAAGYRAIGLDLLGHGLSDKPPVGALYGLDALAEQVLEIARALGPAPITLVGHSLGATVSARAAFLDAPRIARLVLLAPVGLGRVRDAAIGRLLTPAWLTPVLPLLARRVVVVVALRFAFSTSARSRAGLRPFTDADVAEYWATARLPGFTTAMRQLIHVFPWRLRDPAWLGAIRCGTLVVVGTGDRLVDPAGADAYARAIPRAELHRIVGAGHALAEQAPGPVGAALLAFLTSPA
jgi:pimeloyl-ACP methyl ester carboxylesterase